jgi:hypothetical protein
MQRIRRGNQHSIHFRRPAEFRRRIEGQRDLMLPRRLLCLRQVAPRKRRHLAVLRKREARHQALDCMKSEANDSEANHLSLPCERERAGSDIELQRIASSGQGSVLADGEFSNRVRLLIDHENKFRIRVNDD